MEDSDDAELSKSATLGAEEQILTASNEHFEVVAGTAGVYTGTGNVEISFAGKAITVSSSLGASITAVSPGYAARGFIFNNAEIFSSILNGKTPLEWYPHPWHGKERDWDWIVSSPSIDEFRGWPWAISYLIHLVQWVNKDPCVEI